MSRVTQRAISRRQLLRGDPGGRGPAFRPPWALREADFIASCDRCGDCVRSCPEGIIRVGSGGFPEVVFAQGGCTFCGDCVRACGGKALRGAPETARPWALYAEIGGACLDRHGVVCRSCGEVCDERAIRFRLQVGGAAEPMLEAARCTGCGACVSVCPVQAVKMVAVAD